MASILESVVFDAAAFRQELDAFEALLKSKADLAERADIQPFFKAHMHLTAYIGALYLNTPAATEVCFEFDLAGDFRADVLLGSKKVNRFCVVEFEPGEPDAIFKVQPARKNPEWSARFEHAFSQIVDWFYTLESIKHSDLFRGAFGSSLASYMGLLVVGRKGHLGKGMPERLRWRSLNTLVAGRSVIDRHL